MTIHQQPAADRHDVAFALSAIFPNLPFSTSDIEDDGLDGWLIPVPSEVGQAVLAGEDFGWTEALQRPGACDWLVSVFVPAI